MKILRYTTIMIIILMIISIFLMACVKIKQTNSLLQETINFIETQKETITTNSIEIETKATKRINDNKVAKNIASTIITALSFTVEKIKTKYNSNIVNEENPNINLDTNNEIPYEENVETPAETQIFIEEETQNQIIEEEPAILENTNLSSLTPEDLLQNGVIYWGDWRFTWYSENVLPGGGLNIPGRWSDGNFVRDGDGFICCASEDLSFGSILSTPWGDAKVYDSGCDYGTIDIYTSW